MPTETIEFYGEMKYDTEKAYLIYDGIDEIWLPKSKVVSLRRIRDDDYEFIIPLWLAKKKGIV